MWSDVHRDNLQHHWLKQANVTYDKVCSPCCVHTSLCYSTWLQQQSCLHPSLHPSFPPASVVFNQTWAASRMLPGSSCGCSAERCSLFGALQTQLSLSGFVHVIWMKKCEGQQRYGVAAGSPEAVWLYFNWVEELCVIQWKWHNVVLVGRKSIGKETHRNFTVSI